MKYDTISPNDQQRTCQAFNEERSWKQARFKELINASHITYSGKGKRVPWKKGQVGTMEERAIGYHGRKGDRKQKMAEITRTMKICVKENTSNTILDILNVLRESFDYKELFKLHSNYDACKREQKFHITNTTAHVRANFH